MPVYLLIDNGSKKPEATLRLRALATALSSRCGQQVEAVSLQHADKIPADALGGTPAQTFTTFLRSKLAEGERDFRVLPLFFGESRALTSYIPQQYDVLAEEFGDFSIKVAQTIYPLPEGEKRLEEIICQHILDARNAEFLQAEVVLVDHGSPVPRITEVRKSIAANVQAALPDVIRLHQAVMERREGSEYDFNGLLLEEWLRRQAEKGVNSVIVALLFFLPGRHAGAGGDIEEICNRVMKEYPSLSCHITPLVGEHDLVVDILVDRLNAFC